MLNPWRLKLLRQLQLLGTVRAVAEAERMSPSGVSAQLALLEDETKTALFERAGRRLRLTDAGMTLATQAAELLDRMEAIEAQMVDVGTEPAGVVRVAAFSSAMQRYAGHRHSCCR